MIHYPEIPGHAKGSDTSKAAGQSVEITARSMRARAYAFIKQVGGATCDEIEVEFNQRHQTISARLSELRLGGWIERSGSTRPTRSGRQADVYKVRDKAPDPPPAQPAKSTAQLVFNLSPLKDQT
jgi:hypothetical protein